MSTYYIAGIFRFYYYHFSKQKLRLREIKDPTVLFVAKWDLNLDLSDSKVHILYIIIVFIPFCWDYCSLLILVIVKQNTDIENHAQ